MKKLLLISAILTIASSSFASPVDGPVSASGALSPGYRKDYSVILRGEDDWTLLARGFGEGDLDCYVYDSNGNIISSDTDNTNVCVITGMTRWTGEFTVRLVNHGDEPIAYNLEIH